MTSRDVTQDAWRVFRIMGEFVEGFDTLARLGPAVSIFGSARTLVSDRYYQAAEATAHMFIVHPFSGASMARLFSTHPATEERIARLETLRAA